MKVHFKKACKKGFSLVELLVVIAVIGIMAAIAIPLISNINSSAKDAKDRRNAQSIASLANAAVVAGFATAEAGEGGHNKATIWGENADEEGVAELIASADGVKIEIPGPFDGTVFRVPNLTDDDVKGAAKYLTLEESGNVIYDPGYKVD